MSSGLTPQQWHLLWHETLSQDQRSRVRRAVWGGRALDDPDEAAVAVEYARRRDGSGWVVLILVVPVLALLVVLLNAYEPGVSSSYWFMVSNQVFVLLVGPPLRLFSLRRFRRARRVNQAVLDVVDTNKPDITT